MIYCPSCHDDDIHPEDVARICDACDAKADDDGLDEREERRRRRLAELNEY